MNRRDRDRHHRPAPRAARPRLEGLERRELLYATTGGLFAKPARVTYSFVPDGTSVGGIPSDLNAAMAARTGSATAWMTAVRRAAAIWENVANIDLVEVGDDGSAIGVAGNQQNDARFGDIRIGGYAMGGAQLAFAFAPPPFNGGTTAGDLFFNTAQAWKVGTDYDVQTVAIHELGHALGMSHSALSTAAMYASYTGMKQALTTDDVGGIQAIYAAPAADRYDADGANNTYSTADDLTGAIDGTARASIPGLAVSAATDVDWFKITVPASTTGTMVVTMQSRGLGSLAPRVTIYNAALAGLAQGSSAALGDTVAAVVPVVAGQVYYIRAAANQSGAGGVGAYGLRIQLGATATADIPPPDTTVAQQPDQGGGSLAEASGKIKKKTIGTLTGWGDELAARPTRHERTGGRGGHPRGPRRRPRPAAHVSPTGAVDPADAPTRPATRGS